MGVAEIALLRDVPRSATVTAARPSVLLAFGRSDCLEADTGHPAAHDVAQRVAAERSPAEAGQAADAATTAARAAMSAGPVPQQPPSQVAPNVLHDATTSG